MFFFACSLIRGVHPRLEILNYAVLKERFASVFIISRILLYQPVAQAGEELLDCKEKSGFPGHDEFRKSFF